jgi:F-type H+-transporting ATPase subunit b
MTIDWFTFTAQILNFLILIWLMKRFLYGPIINAMDQRESRIASRLQEAKDATAQADAREHEFRQKTEELATAREELFAEVGRDVESWRTEHMHEARTEVEQARRDWQLALAREKQSLVNELQLNVARHATDIARHVLNQLADERLQSLLVAKFLQQMDASEPDVHQLLKAAHQTRIVQVECSHELTSEQHQQIDHAIRSVTGSDAAIEFRTNPDLICGIELTTQGCKVAWSIQESIAELESDLIDAIDGPMPDVSEAASPRQNVASDAEAVS